MNIKINFLIKWNICKLVVWITKTKLHPKNWYILAYLKSFQGLRWYISYISVIWNCETVQILVTVALIQFSVRLSLCNQYPIGRGFEISLSTNRLQWMTEKACIMVRNSILKNTLSYVNLHLLPSHKFKIFPLQIIFEIMYQLLSN